MNRACLVTCPAGVPLTAEMLENGNVPLPDCFAYGRQLIRILKTVHNAGFLHCDIHPGNFIVDDEKKKVFLIDWELARRAKDQVEEKECCGVGMFGLYSISFAELTTLSPAAYLSDAFLRAMVARVPYVMTWRDDLISLGFALLFLSNGNLPWIGSDCAEILAARQNFDFPRWFRKYTETVTAMDNLDSSYENLAAQLLEFGPKDKCSVILQHARNPRRNGFECGKGLPCPHHNAKAKKWQKANE